MTYQRRAKSINEVRGTKSIIKNVGRPTKNGFWPFDYQGVLTFLRRSNQ